MPKENAIFFGCACLRRRASMGLGRLAIEPGGKPRQDRRVDHSMGLTVDSMNPASSSDSLYFP